jgi:hypothetical protein
MSSQKRESTLQEKEGGLKGAVSSCDKEKKYYLPKDMGKMMLEEERLVQEGMDSYQWEGSFQSKNVNRGKQQESNENQHKRWDKKSSDSAWEWRCPICNHRSKQGHEVFHHEWKPTNYQKSMIEPRPLFSTYRMKNAWRGEAYWNSKERSEQNKTNKKRN